MMKNDSVSVLQMMLKVLVVVESNVQKEIGITAFPYITSAEG